MNPVYFNYGIAVHGADNVPLEPASHGCVRLQPGDCQGVPVAGQEAPTWSTSGGRRQQPEQYTKRDSLPSFNYANPDATTTTSSTTTTVAPTTVAPTTTAVKSTTTTPAATTTTTPPPTSVAPSTSTASFG